MVLASRLFTSESVSEGHPDKICDRLSDEVVDAFFRAAAKEGYDPLSVRVACEVLVTRDRVLVAGEVCGPSSVTSDVIEEVTRSAIRDIGYEQEGFHWDMVDVEILLRGQSSQIAEGVNGINKPMGAGDQGIMFGYACLDTAHLMPAPIYYAHKILEQVSKARKNGHGDAKLLGPDAKTQISVQYVDGKPNRITDIVLSVQHLDENLSSSDVKDIVYPHVLAALPEGWVNKETEWYVNPTGKFVIGGPNSDCGLTGRKVVVDTYGGAAPHGGGAFSGKDPTKVDRSAAYVARYMAKNVIAAGLAERCTIQLAYSIAVPKPIAFYIDLHGTGCVSEKELAKLLTKTVGLSPADIVSRLDLCRPIYARTSAYGHFGRAPAQDGGFSWEKLDLVDELAGLCSS